MSRGHGAQPLDVQRMLVPDTTEGSLSLLRVRLCSSDMPPVPPPARVLSTVCAASAGPIVQFRAQVLQSWKEQQSWQCEVSGNQQVPVRDPKP